MFLSFNDLFIISLQSRICGSSLCDVNADCNSDDQCVCRDGFSGSGHECSDINECEEGSHCHPSALCLNSIGSFICLCPEGQAGDGKIDCHSQSECASRDEWGRCICSPGFAPRKSNSRDFETLARVPTNDSSECEDIDECAEGISSCSSLSNCLNLWGSYICSCLPGHEGNGHICVKGRAVVEVAVRIVIGPDEYQVVRKNDSMDRIDDLLNRINVTKFGQIIIQGISTVSSIFIMIFQNSI